MARSIQNSMNLKSLEIFSSLTTINGIAFDGGNKASGG